MTGSTSTREYQQLTTRQTIRSSRSTSTPQTPHYAAQLVPRIGYDGSLYRFMAKWHRDGTIIARAPERELLDSRYAALRDGFGAII